MDCPFQAPVRSHRGLALLAAAVLGLAACSSTDPALYSSDDRPIASLPRIPYIVGVATPVLQLHQGPGESEEADAGTGEHAPTDDTATSTPSIEFKLLDDSGDVFADVRSALVERMNELGTASDVVAIEASKIDDVLDAAYEAGCDLVIVPRFSVWPELRAQSVSDRHLLGLGFWLLTWIGGMFVDDYTYTVRATVEMDVWETESRLRIAGFDASSEVVDLAYVDRNDFLSLTTVTTFIMPTFWTTDDSDETAKSLSRWICDHVAAQTTGYLKEQLVSAEHEELGEIEIRTPVNDAKVGDSVLVSGSITAAQEISELRVFVDQVRIDEDGRQQVTRSKEPAFTAPAPAFQRVGSQFRWEFSTDSIRLPPVPDPTDSRAENKTRIVLEVQVRGDVRTRTLVVRR